VRRLGLIVAQKDVIEGMALAERGGNGYERRERDAATRI
jgi:hypothetical protein